MHALAASLDAKEVRECLSFPWGPWQVVSLLDCAAYVWAKDSWGALSPSCHRKTMHEWKPRTRFPPCIRTALLLWTAFGMVQDGPMPSRVNNIAPPATVLREFPERACHNPHAPSSSGRMRLDRRSSHASCTRNEGKEASSSPVHKITTPVRRRSELQSSSRSLSCPQAPGDPLASKTKGVRGMAG